MLLGCLRRLVVDKPADLVLLGLVGLLSCVELAAAVEGCGLDRVEGKTGTAVLDSLQGACKFLLQSVRSLHHDGLLLVIIFS